MDFRNKHRLSAIDKGIHEILNAPKTMKTDKTTPEIRKSKIGMEDGRSQQCSIYKGNNLKLKILSTKDTNGYAYKVESTSQNPKKQNPAK